MLRIFEGLYRQPNGDEDFYHIRKIAVNVDNIISVEVDDVFDEEKKETFNQTIIRMSNGDEITILQPFDEVVKILCGAKI